MARWWNPFRFLRGRKQRIPPRAADRSDADLERFFTDAIEARDSFKRLVDSKPLAKRVVVVFGIGAVGKSSLLRMYRLYGRRAHVPVCLVAGEDTPSAVSLLSQWAKDLSDDGLALPRFAESLRHYREIQAKVDQAAREAGEAEAEAAQKLGEAALKGGLEILAAVVPGGALIEAVGSEAVGPLLNLLRAKLSKPDFDLYIDPVARLTDDFVTDLRSSAENRRTVLMLDTFEQLKTLSAWLAGTIQRLPEEALAVVAGREAPDWEHVWPGWVGSAELIELRELSDADMKDLVQATYRLYERSPTQEQVNAIVRFARGLPMAARTIIHLSIVHGSGDLSPSDPRVVADLAERLLSDVPQEMRPAFEAAAVLRYFQQDSLRALLDDIGVSEAEALYRELTRWPFVRPRQGGLAVHDTMRDVINDAVRTRSPESFRTLQRQAAAYYAREADRASSEERDGLVREGLYHAVRADEADGVRLFRGFAEQLTRNQMVGRLRTLLTDAETYPLQNENSRLWRRYYEARLAHLEGRLAPAESIYRDIGDDGGAEAALRAYALSDLGSILDDLDRLSEPDGERRAEEVVRRSFELQPEPDVKIASNFVTQMNISNARADWDQSLEHIEALRGFAERAHDDYELARAERLRAANHALRGDWGGYLDARKQALDTVDRLGDVPALRMEVAYFTWPLTFMGRCQEALDSAERALELGNELQEKELMITILESVALPLGMQDRFDDARGRFAEAMNFLENVHGGVEGHGARERYIRATLSFRGLVSLREGSLDPALADLQRALEIKRAIADRIGMPEMHVWLGHVHELRSDWDRAAAEYRRAGDLRDVGRAYFQCAALTGLVRIHRAQGEDAESEELLGQAERIAIRFEYNDLLASLRLSEGYMAWDSTLGSRPNGRAAAEAGFREALVHGLRHNRFLLDEVLSGRAHASMLRPITTSCLDRGEEGREMLDSLRAWWEEGQNALEGEAGKSISPLELGLSLKEAERIARAREPGSGTAQRTLIEQIDQAVN